MKDGDYPLRSTPCQMLVKEESFLLAHSLDSLLFSKTGWDQMHPYWGAMVTDSGPRGGRREEVKGGKMDIPECGDRVLRWP